MSREPAPAGPPRFHASPFSWAKPRTGPFAAQPAVAAGPNGHWALQCHTWLLVPGPGSSATSGRGAAEPQPARSASTVSADAASDRRRVRWADRASQRAEEHMAMAADDGDRIADDGRLRDGPEDP